MKNIINNNNSITKYGSEFKKVGQLKLLLEKNRRWEMLKKHLEDGVDFSTEAVK